jgi:tetratricopeptide (TPR) repeat protein
MPQPLPVIRQLYLPGLIPQAFAIALLSAIAWFAAPPAYRGQAILFGAASYLVICRVLRLLLVRDHTRGMQAYRAGRFRDAIIHFEASHRFFSEYPRLDASRSLLFGVASHNPYRLIALGNMAYCYGQVGEGAKAVELYERVLREAPDHAVARASLNLLRASHPQTGAA